MPIVKPIGKSFGPSALHRLVQALFFLAMLACGIQFAFFAAWAMGASELFVPRPASAEGFLPISALIALKRLVLAGQWDPVHPAGLAILLCALAAALFLRKGFCGYVCPLGALSHWLFRLGARAGIMHQPSPKFGFLWTLPKYALLVFVLWIAFGAMDLEACEAFLLSRYNMVADTKMLLFFLHPSATLLACLAFLLGGSLLFPSFWCRCFCPYGALLGLLSACSPLAVRRDPGRCTGCRQCQAHCPQGIAVHLAERINSPECTGCLECQGHCPSQGCLEVRAGWGRRSLRLPWWSMALATAGLFLAVWLAARATGHWDNALPREMLRLLHKGIETLQHF